MYVVFRMLTTRGVITVTSDAPSCSMKIVQGRDPLAQPTTLLFLGDLATMVFETRGELLPLEPLIPKRTFLLSTYCREMQDC